MDQDKGVHHRKTVSTNPYSVSGNRSSENGKDGNEKRLYNDKIGRHERHGSDARSTYNGEFSSHSDHPSEITSHVPRAPPNHDRSGVNVRINHGIRPFPTSGADGHNSVSLDGNGNGDNVNVDDDASSSAAFTVTRETVCPESRNGSDANNQHHNSQAHHGHGNNAHLGNTSNNNGNLSNVHNNLRVSVARSNYGYNVNPVGTSVYTPTSTSGPPPQGKYQNSMRQPLSPNPNTRVSSSSSNQNSNLVSISPEEESYIRLRNRIHASDRPCIIQHKKTVYAADQLELVPRLQSAYERSELGLIENVWFSNNSRINDIIGVIPRLQQFNQNVDVDGATEREFAGEYTENNGYDNKEGCYKFVLGEHIEYRYEILSFLGKGSFGQVIKCFDHKRDNVVALKMSRNRTRLQQQAALEIQMLEKLMRLPHNFDPAAIPDKGVDHGVTNQRNYHLHGLENMDMGSSLNPHASNNNTCGEWSSGYKPLPIDPNAPYYDMLRTGHHHIVRIHGYFTFRSHISVTFEPLSVNLYEFLRMNSHYGVSELLTRRIGSQILLGLCFLFQHGVIHCDQKPENILFVPYGLHEGNRPVKVRPVNGNIPMISTSIRLIDLGSSCIATDTTFSYIQSRFYRAPEIILGLPYGLALDMWSFGCILAELWIGFPLQPGDNEMEQMTLAIDMLGLPPAYMITHTSCSKNYFHEDGTLQPELAAQIERISGSSVKKYLQTNKGMFRVNSIFKKTLVRYGYTQDPAAATNKKNDESLRRGYVAEYYKEKRRILGTNTESPRTLLDVIQQNEPVLHNLILACLQWDSSRRITPKQALQHPFFTSCDQQSTAFANDLQRDIISYILPANLILQDHR